MWWPRFLAGSRYRFPAFAVPRVAATRVDAQIGRGGCLPCRSAYQLTRAETGIPSVVIRLITVHPVFASVR
jgi:hypothetical protein